MNGKLYVKYRSYGTNDIDQCESVEIRTKSENAWTVRFRKFYSTRLLCYDTTVNVSLKGEETLVLAYRVSDRDNPRLRELLYMNESEHCFIFGSIGAKEELSSREEGISFDNATKRCFADGPPLLKSKRRCEMLMPENDVKNNVGQCCKLVFKAVCGSSTPGSYRPGCMEEPEDEKLCPKLLPIGC
ncbi:uncharacterized protein LOC144123272 [Amblyomma americanum]